MTSMMIIFATANEGKLNEIREITRDFGVGVLSMKEAGIDLDIPETGSTFKENAIIKAEAIREICPPDAVVLADDSGLAIDFLGGEPGVYSARYLGESTSYRIKNQNLIDRMADAAGEERGARFICAIAASLPGGETVVCEEAMEGLIAYEESGENGFGYDPIFFLPEYGKTSAALSCEEKNRISHRGKALMKMRDVLVERGVLA